MKVTKSGIPPDKIIFTNSVRVVIKLTCFWSPLSLLDARTQHIESRVRPWSERCYDLTDICRKSQRVGGCLAARASVVGPCKVLVPPSKIILVLHPRCPRRQTLLLPTFPLNSGFMSLLWESCCEYEIRGGSLTYILQFDVGPLYSKTAAPFERFLSSSRHGG